MRLTRTISILALLWSATFHIHFTASAPVRVTFYPTVEIPEAGGASRVHNRPPSRSSASLASPYIIPSTIADVCVTYAVNSSTQFLGNGTIPDHSADNVITLHPGEVFCNTGEGVFPTTISQALLRNQFRVKNTQDSLLPHFAFFACSNLPDNWYTDEDCDTNERKTGPGGLTEDCSDMNSLARQTSLLCKACAWDCAFGVQCFESLGLPPLPFFDPGSNNTLPCTNPEDCRFLCCFTQQRTSDTVSVNSVCTGISKNSCGQGGKTTTCSAEASWNVNTPRSTAQIQQYRCSFACDFPCATGTAVSISECESPLDRKTLCFPGVMDRQCTVNILTDPLSVCPDNTGVPVVYKNVTQAQALGEDPFVFHATTDTELSAPGQPRRCTQPFERACDDPICKCLSNSDCPKHPLCNGHGTRMDSLYPHVPSTCVCEAGFYGATCQSRVSDIGCNGLTSTSDRTVS